MLTPGPDHPITINKSPHRLRVTFNGTVVAESANALELREASYPSVFYIPRADVRSEYFRRSEHSSRCPYKGDASYFSLEVAGKRAENTGWTYEEPYPAVEEIKDCIAFYRNKVDAIEEF